MKNVAFIAAALLAGCASNSGVVPTGPDTYFVARQGASSFTGQAALKGETLTEAGAFCRDKGKTLQVLSQKDAEPPFVLGNFPKSEVQFRCV